MKIDQGHAGYTVHVEDCTQQVLSPIVEYLIRLGAELQRRADTALIEPSDPQLAEWLFIQPHADIQSALVEAGE